VAAVGDSGTRPRLNGEQRRTLLRVQLYASDARSELLRAWERTHRHNRSIEGLALWNTLRLDEECATLIADDLGWLRSGSAAIDYDREAGVRMVPALLPFSDLQKGILRDAEIRHDPRAYVSSYEQGVRRMTEAQPALVERWHEWLWQPAEHGTRGEEPSTDGQLFAEACARLARSLGTLAID
jgi:hypothetical protein